MVAISLVSVWFWFVIFLKMASLVGTVHTGKTDNEAQTKLGFLLTVLFCARCTVIRQFSAVFCEEHVFKFYVPLYAVSSTYTLRFVAC